MPSPHDGPARRGRRDPDLAAQLESPPEPDFADVEDDGSGTPDSQLVYTGDIVTAKLSLALPIGGDEAWVTYGLSTRVGPDEEEVDVFDRVAMVVNSRALNLAEDAEERVRALQEERHQAVRNRRITPER